MTRRTPPSGNRAFGYTRVSTAGQADQGYSLASQEQKIRAYAAYRGLALQEIFSDPAASAAKLRLGEREGGSKLMLALRPGDHVILPKVDRAWRNAADAHGIVSAWREEGISLHLLDVAVDTSTAMGKLFFGLLASFAEWERDMISERTIAGLEQARQEGKWTGRAPFGFRHVNGELTPIPSQVVQAAILLRGEQAQLPHATVAALLAALPSATLNGLPWTERRARNALERVRRHAAIVEEALRTIGDGGVVVALAAIPGEAPVLRLRDARTGAALRFASLPAAPGSGHISGVTDQNGP